LGDDHTKAPGFEIDLFGPIAIRVQGNHLPPLPSRKGAYLLALLALRHDREVERDYLAGLLWPESEQEKALFNLRQTLSRLRQALGSEAWRLHAPARHTLRLDVGGASVDVVAFDAALTRQEPEAWRAAVALYRGPLLEGCDEAWAFAARREREDAFLTALERLAVHAVHEGDTSAAAGYLRQVIAVDAWREAAYRSLMQVYAAGGEYAEATHLYRELRLLLRRELNTTPAPETVALYRQIFAGTQDTARIYVAPTFLDNTFSDNTTDTVDTGDPQDSDHPAQHQLETAGGAVPLDSPFYIPRSVDTRFETAILNRHSVILVKGTRQTGKTSLLVRGLKSAGVMGAAVVYTNVNALDAAVLESREALYRTLMGELADQLDLDVPTEQVWNTDRAANTNLDRYLRREILGHTERPLVWALDEVDRLFACEFRNEVFALFRSWHDRRAMDPVGSWSRLTLVLSYTTEAHLFITDLNQSPFNVGTRLTLEDFTPAQVADLNARYGRPLKNDNQVARFQALVGGHPYLVRRGLDAMGAEGLDIDGIAAQADREDGLYGSHLHHLYRSVIQDPDLTDLLRAVLRGNVLSSNVLSAEIGYYRLFSAGILAADADHQPRLRCRVYETYLTRRLLSAQA
jgi:DNA-binding SARP family transcriptional activator